MAYSLIKLTKKFHEYLFFMLNLSEVDFRNPLRGLQPLGIITHMVEAFLKGTKNKIFARKIKKNIEGSF